MENTKRELNFLRIWTLCSMTIFVLITIYGFNKSGNPTFNTIDVQRINIVEPDGTVKMIITNLDQFPNGMDTINGRSTNVNRKKRSGMLFFNEDGIECGGFIYDGSKNENGHSSGLSLTYDQYDGDQVMQLLTTDTKKGDKRTVSSTLMFQDRAVNESQEGMREIMNELNSITDPKLRRARYKEYEQKQFIGSKPRIMLGKSKSNNNGLFLFDQDGKAKAMFYVDGNNNAKLEFYDDNGEITASFPK
ncbi:hypothetical protein [Zhouia amylolytica]|uniref:Uncharacterized protein n=1 Tax=Zhouia amylolytica AD3 TaxID=1286632 RepID=W2UJC8_9FLAO|nr:hypothetical protein [Zhouia amylolytica]ETN94118.1 hypothetical protein P278_29220 [Zhouia amylolytica AD3]MCQ0112371.1 hypothetical protein [Zhouia amylolytica]